jgi:glutamyl-tRNA synthetase
MDLPELIRSFDLERVSKAGAKFDPQKTLWFQHQYMHRKEVDVLTDLFAAYMEESEEIPAAGREAFQGKNRDYHRRVVALLQERVVFVRDFWEQGKYFYLPPATYDPKATKKAWKNDTAVIMSELTEVLQTVSPFESAGMETVVKNWIGEKEYSFGKVLMPFRLSLVGSMSGPHVFDIAAMIGLDETLSRIQKAIAEMG